MDLSLLSNTLGRFFFYLTANAVSALHQILHVREVEQSMTGARQTVAVMITFRKSNKDSLDLGAGVPNFIYLFIYFFFCPTSISMLWR